MLVFTNKNISQMLSDNFFTYIFINISSNFLRFFNQFFMSIDNIINIFIYTFLIFLTSFKKKYKLLLIIIIGVLFQLLIGSITLNRYIQPQYLIYIDIITIFYLFLLFLI